MERLKFSATDFARAAPSLKKRNEARRISDKIAQEVFRAGFPETFEIELSGLGSETLKVTYEIDEKKINEGKSHHQVIFVYGLTVASSKQLRTTLKSIIDEEDDDNDLSYLTSINEIEVIGEFSNKFDSVWGIIK